MPSGEHRAQRTLAASAASIVTVSSAAAILLGAACARSAPEQRPAEVIVRDSAGITIVDNPEHAPDATGWWIDTIPIVVIGGDNASAPHIFSWIADVELLSDGRVVVADGSVNEVRMFNPTGSFLRTVGRRGQGPGEYRGAHRLLRLAGDSILVMSGYEGAAALVFGPEGDYVRTISAPDFRLDDSLRQVYRPPGIAGVFADGTLLATSSVADRRPLLGGVPGGEATLQESKARLVRGAPSGAVLAGYGDHVLGRYYRYQGPDPRMAGAIFDDQALIARPRVATSGSELFVSDGSTTDVFVFSQDGALARIVRRRAAVVPVPRAVVDSVWGAYVRVLSRSPDARWLMNAEPPPLAAPAPAVDGLLFDPAGNMWVRSSVPGDAFGTLWHVFDPNGLLQHSLRWRGDIRRIGRERVVSVVSDGESPPRVVVYRLNRRE